ncbi:MAG: hypothetical protein ACE37K_11430 [Planctomycetota bacterium]
MSGRGPLEERLLDTMLAEVEGQTPDDRLVARTMARLEQPADAVAAIPERPASRWLLAAAVLAIGVVTALSVWSRGDGGGGDEATLAPEDLQDPQGRSPEAWIEALRDEGARRQAVRALARGGAAEVRAMIGALADEKAPREHVLEALHAMGPRGVEALAAVTMVVIGSEVHDPLLGPAMRTVATLAPYGTERQRNDARRAVLFKAFVNNGPAAAAGPGLGGRRRPTYSTRDVARLLHRLEVPREASQADLLTLLDDGSPYVRELAAEMLRGHATPAVRNALHRAMLDEHPEHLEVQWRLQEGFSGKFRFVEQYDGMIRLAAARSLAHVADGMSISALAHVLLLEVGGIDAQRRAARALARIEIDAGDQARVEQVVVARMDSDDARLLCELAIVAGRFERLSAEARAQLERLVGHEDRKVAACASAALRMHR